MQNRVTDHIRSSVIGYLALFLALTGGVAWANHPGGANTITSGDIVNGEVKTGDIGDLEVRAADVAADSLGSTKIANGSVKNIDLGAGASSSNTIADGGIQAVDVQNNTLTGAQIAESTLFNDNSLTGADIDESTLTGLPSANAWGLGGNSGTTAVNFLGTTDNQPLNLRVNNARALRLEPASDGTNQSPNVIGGSANNAVTAGVHSATIAGGGRADPADPSTANEVTDDYGTVGGGANNTASGEAATVAGGFSNTASGSRATVVGGQASFATAPFSLAGGRNAHADHQGAFVWADSSPFFLFSPNFSSTAPDQFSVRATGGTRLVSAVNGLTGAPTAGLELPPNTSGLSTLGSAQPFDVSVNGSRGLRIEPASDGTNQSPNVIGGIADNTVTPGVHSATIGGGGRGVPTDPATANRVTDHQGVVGGGANNQAGDGAGTADDRAAATVGGGFFNTASGQWTTVGGGGHNTASGAVATVGGGSSNEASGNWDTVAGGLSNTASGFEATVGGGEHNAASGQGATVPGGAGNSAEGRWTFAAGTSATADDEGAFVWADARGFDFASTAQNQFSVRATGGTRFISGIDPFSGGLTAGVELAPGGGSWSSLSDRASKRAVEPASGLEVLRDLASVPISTWSYRSQDDSIRHIGPMAQDFYRAFGVGEDRRHISSVDADGVALAAIKGLNRKVERLQRKLAELQRRTASR